MEIAIDATTLLFNQAGITSYLKGLLDGFAQISEVGVQLLTTGKAVSQQSEVAKKVTTLYREVIWQRYYLPQKAQELKADILFSPSHLIATKSHLPRFVTFHDFYVLRRPEAFTKWHAYYSRLRYPKIMDSSPHVIVISEFTKQELFYFFPKFRGTVEVVPNGISKEWRPINNKNDLQAIAKKFNLPSEFIFSVGSLEPRKNFISLFRMMSAAKKDHLPPLVLVIPNEWGMQSDATLMAKLIADKKLYILKNVDRCDLVGLYNLAQCMIYPSLYEGFGIPPMEAMACGCPVITSANSALKELYSDTAVMVNPVDIEQLYESVQQLLTDGVLRNNLINKGYLLSQQYNYTSMSRNTYNYFLKYAA